MSFLNYIVASASPIYTRNSTLFKKNLYLEIFLFFFFVGRCRSVEDKSKCFRSAFLMKYLQGQKLHDCGLISDANMMWSTSSLRFSVFQTLCISCHHPWLVSAMYLSNWKSWLKYDTVRDAVFLYFKMTFLRVPLATPLFASGMRQLCVLVLNRTSLLSLRGRHIM